MKRARPAPIEASRDPLARRALPRRPRPWMSPAATTAGGVPSASAPHRSAPAGMMASSASRPPTSAATRGLARATPARWQREGVVVLFGAALLPLAGAFGLWDPWETHTWGRPQILSPTTGSPLWWAQGLFMRQKPILVFWMAALGMGAGSPHRGQLRRPGPGAQEWFIHCRSRASPSRARRPLPPSQPWELGRPFRRDGARDFSHCSSFAHRAMTDMPSRQFVLAMSASVCSRSPPTRGETRGRTRSPSAGANLASLWHLGGRPGSPRRATAEMPTSSRARWCSGATAGADLARCPRRAVQRVSTSSSFETYFIGSAGSSSPSLAASVPARPAGAPGSVVPFMPRCSRASWAAAPFLPPSLRERKDAGAPQLRALISGARSARWAGPAGLPYPARWRCSTSSRRAAGASSCASASGSGGDGVPRRRDALVRRHHGRLGGEFLQRFFVATSSTARRSASTATPAPARLLPGQGG